MGSCPGPMQCWTLVTVEGGSRAVLTPLQVSLWDAEQHAGTLRTNTHGSLQVFGLWWKTVKSGCCLTRQSGNAINQDKISTALNKPWVIYNKLCKEHYRSFRARGNYSWSRVRHCLVLVSSSIQLHSAGPVWALLVLPACIPDPEHFAA